MTFGIIGGDGKARDFEAEASSRAELKHNLTRTSWTLARNGSRCAYQSVGHDLPSFSHAEMGAARRQPARDKKSLQQSNTPYEVDEDYLSASNWTTNERARQGPRADAQKNAVEAALAGADSRRKAKQLKASLTRSNHSMGDGPLD